jgi:hypothetical protein
MKNGSPVVPEGDGTGRSRTLELAYDRDAVAERL